MIDLSSTTYSIREVSQQFNLPASTLRYYEKVGLLKEIPRNGKHRVYSQEHLNRLGAIQCFKQTGMSINQIQKFFYYEDETGDFDALIELLTQQSQAINQQLTLLLENQNHIQQKLAHYQEKKICYQKNLATKTKGDQPCVMKP